MRWHLLNDISLSIWVSRIFIQKIFLNWIDWISSMTHICLFIWLFFNFWCKKRRFSSNVNLFLIIIQCLMKFTKSEQSAQIKYEQSCTKSMSVVDQSWIDSMSPLGFNFHGNVSGCLNEIYCNWIWFVVDMPDATERA